MLAVLGGRDISLSGGTAEDVAAHFGFVVGSVGAGIVFLLAIAYALELLVGIFDHLDGLRIDILELTIDGDGGPYG